MKTSEKKVSYSCFIKQLHREELQSSCLRDYYLEKDLKVETIDNGIVLPARGTDGGVFSNGHFYEHSSVHRKWGQAYEFSDTDIVFRDEDVVYVGMWNPAWGHCITDNIKHLWILLDEKYSFLHSLKWVYTASDVVESPNFMEFLQRIGVPMGQLEKISSTTRFRTVYLPDDCFIYTEEQRFYTPDYARLIDRLLSQVPDQISTAHSPHKIYFSRTGIAQTWQRDTGEESIEKVFKKLGYSIFHPEQLSFVQQLQLLQHCDAFAATEGSVAHNALFLKEGASFICIRKANYCNGYQFPINQLKKLSVTLIDANATLSSVKPWWGPFFLYNSRQLQKYAKTGFTPFPIFSYLAYLYRFEPRINHLKSRVKRIVVRQHGKKKSLQDCL